MTKINDQYMVWLTCIDLKTLRLLATALSEYGEIEVSLFPFAVGIHRSLFMQYVSDLAGFKSFDTWAPNNAKRISFDELLFLDAKKLGAKKGAAKRGELRSKRCGSQAINHHLHGRDGSDGDLCDVCYWRKRAKMYKETANIYLAERQELRDLFPACLDEYGPGLFEAAKAEVERLRKRASNKKRKRK